MTAPSPPAAPTAKSPPPPLMARAFPPKAIRLRPAVALSVGLAAALLVGGAMAWAFVVRPDLRARDRAEAAEGQVQDPRGSARPSEMITAQPASYDRLADPLPPPRRLGAPGQEAGDPPTPPRRKPTPRRGARTDEPASERPGAVADRSGLFFSIAKPAPPRAAPPVDAPPVSPAPAGDPGFYNPHRLTRPLSPFELKAGTLLPATLLTAVDTSHAGPVIAVLNADVFDTVTGRHRLLPQGTRLVGRHAGAGRHGDKRAVLTWDRLILPDGRSLALPGEPGVDAQGATGVRGRVDRRLGPLAFATLVAGAITALGEAARDKDEGGGWLGDAGDAAAVEAAQVGGRLIDRELDVAPTLRLDPGTPAQVLITRDLVLEPYPS